ncbi:MAG: DUF1622 domain-containing protein [Acidimicrobiales bacterium]|nr:DUF1622 domain-containing protein [Acidimicrobiales bacterium]
MITIVAGIGWASLRAVAGRHDRDERYRCFRRDLGRVILLGLEILVAADIIRTVAVSPSVESAGALAIVVAIRIALSFSLEVELEGRWPWRRGDDPHAPG